eukprot:2401238-Amphidinium_carterae.1
MAGHKLVTSAGRHRCWFGEYLQEATKPHILFRVCVESHTTVNMAGFQQHGIGTRGRADSACEAGQLQSELPQK